MQETKETWVQSLGQDDPLEKEIATHSSILAWKTPSIGSQSVGHDLAMEKQRGLSRSRCSGYEESLIITSKKPFTVLCHLSCSLHVVLVWGTWQGHVCYKPFPMSNSTPMSLFILLS